MTFELISNEKNVATVKLNISAEDFETAIDAAYKKNKNKFNVPGFRKGKVPRSIIEGRYGKEVLYEDALDEAFPKAYTECLDEGKFEPVAAPKLVSIDDIGENGAKVTIEISLNPEFELGQYKGIKIEPVKYTVKKSDVEEVVDQLKEQNSRLVTLDNGKSESGDTVTINFEGFVDGVAFEGGKGESYPLVLGSNTFIPGFEDQLIGKKQGQKVDVKVKFPDEYHSDELSGKDAVFKCEVLSIQRKELPEADDDFAVDLGYDNLEDMNKKLKAEIKERKLAELKQAAQNKIMETVIDNTAVELPPQMVAERTQQIRQENEEMLKKNKIDPEQYYEYMKQLGGEENSFDPDAIYAEQASKELKSELVVRKIIETEKIEATEKELEDEYGKYAQAYNKTVEEFKSTLTDYAIDYIKYTIAQSKLADFLFENADTSK